MPRLSANIGILFQERPFLDRFKAAADAGFAAVECWTPYNIPIAEIAARLAEAGIPLIGINGPMGDPKQGDMGLAGIPGREREFDDSITLALDYATELNARHIHVMAGNAAGLNPTECLVAYRGNLARAAQRAEAAGITLVIEPINRRDRPTYLLGSCALAAEIIDDIGSPRLKMMFDFYHMQINEGDVTRLFAAHLDRIGHIQIAAVPSRAEPDEGELNYGFILREIDRLGWQGFVGAEYQPRTTTEAGLGWREKVLG